MKTPTSRLAMLIACASTTFACAAAAPARPALPTTCTPNPVTPNHAIYGTFNVASSVAFASGDLIEYLPTSGQVVKIQPSSVTNYACVSIHASSVGPALRTLQLRVKSQEQISETITDAGDVFQFDIQVQPNYKDSGQSRAIYGGIHFTFDDASADSGGTWGGGGK